MSDILIALNKAQQPAIILNPKNTIDVWGRGTGKSFLIGWDIDKINKQMPRSITAITARTYGQAMTKTLPSTFKFLEKLGYHKNIHYVINKQPLANFDHPYEQVLEFDNFISFINGTGYMILTQDRKGSARGPNVDYEIVDEALTIDKIRYDSESHPTNRGNGEAFGRKSKKPISFHHGHHYVSSMPYSSEGKWLLAAGDYYEKDAGIRLKDIWNRIVKMQLDLLDISDPKEFASLWNEIVRLRKQITPFLHVDEDSCLINPKTGQKDLTTGDTYLFTLANAFDNLENVNLSYIREQRETTTPLIFMIEIMNMIVDTVEDCYYNIDSDRHIYYNSYNNDFIQGVAEDTDYDFDRLSESNNHYDADCNTDKPLEIVIDWGVRSSFLIVMQEQIYDFVTKLFTPTDNAINSFFVKPEKNHVMIDDLAHAFCNYYKTHQCRRVSYYKDKYGDHEKVNSGKTFNEQFVDILIKEGWEVTIMSHRGIEPPHHDKYLLWANTLRETRPEYPKFRINGNKCKYVIISMKNTKVIEKAGKFEKDKRSEHPNSGVLPEEAPHFGDALDKLWFTKYGQRIKRNTSFVDTRY